MTIAGDPASEIQFSAFSPRNGARAERKPMKMMALTGVRERGWSLPNHLGIITALAMAHISLDDPMRKAFHEVMIPARQPAMTSLPQTVDPNMGVRASAVTRSCEPSWSAGIATDVMPMTTT